VQELQRRQGLNVQHIENEAHRAALLVYLGYSLNRAVSDELGTQYLFSDPGDIKDAIKSFEDGVQVADAKTLLIAYDGILTKPLTRAPSAEPNQVTAAVYQVAEESEEEWTSGDFGLCCTLVVFGFHYRGARVVRGRARFVFSKDTEVFRVLNDYRNGQVLCDPQALTSAAFKLRLDMKNAYDKHKAGARQTLGTLVEAKERCQ
jgi:hypothetical protein